MSHLIWDLSFAAVGIGFVLLGIHRGLILSVLKLCRFFLAVGISYLFGGIVGEWIGGAWKASSEHQMLIGKLVGYAIVFLLTFVGLSVAYFFIKTIKEKIRILNMADKLLGGLLGGVMALAVLLLSASVIRLFFAEREFYTQSVILRTLGDCQFEFLNLNEWIR